MDNDPFSFTLLYSKVVNKYFYETAKCDERSNGTLSRESREREAKVEPYNTTSLQVFGTLVEIVSVFNKFLDSKEGQDFL